MDVDHNTPLMLAVEGGSAGITEILLEYGSDVNHYNKSRVYPLHSACTNGSLDIVKILVQVGFVNNAAFTYVLLPADSYFQERALVSKNL